MDAQLNKLLLRYGKHVDREGPVQPGDTVDVSIVVTDAGEEVHREESVRVEAVSNLSLRDTTIKDFDKLIVGATKGEARMGKAKISDGAENEAMRGKELDFAITVKSISHVEFPAAHRLLPARHRWV